MIDSLALNKQFSGCVILADNFSNTIVQECRGYSDVKKSIANTHASKFSLASVGKFFTMVGTLKLIEEQRLMLDDSLEKFNFNFSDPRAHKITIRQLLAHKSGFGHYWNNPEFLKKRSDLDSISEYLDFISRKKLDFDPGSEYQYSNEGYIVLGAVIEKISGMDFYSFVNQKIFEPLNMKDTGFPYLDVLDSSFAKPYVKNQNHIWVESNQEVSLRGASDGGGYSSIRDLSILLNAVFNHNFITKKSVSLLSSNFENENLKKNGQIFELVGAFPGVSASIGFHGPTGLNIAVLSNYDSPASENVVIGVLNIITKASLKKEHHTSTKISYLKGTVYDKNGAPIPYVNIGIENTNVGTASDEKGNFTINIPAARINEMLTVSALGYEKQRIEIKTVQDADAMALRMTRLIEALPEVIVTGKKKKIVKVGNKGLGIVSSGAYIGGKIPGASLITKIKIESPGKLMKLRVHIRNNRLGKNFKLRARILECIDGKNPGKDILQTNILVASNLKKGWLEFDLENSGIYLTETVFIGVEWVDKHQIKESASTAYPRVSYTPKAKAISFARANGLKDWKPIGIDPNFYVLLSVDQ
ncbi:serine hydrolase [Spongiimicrobium sp. 3-5]|uniref:serine hydrolase n=1 Tax=Spongiimicrobium sp. 3-5 TaxID=3332596 RepID=UPI0039818223